MSSFYSIIQFVPDPVADERINIGVVVFGEGIVKAKFVRSWSRISRFGNRDITFLKDFASDFMKAIDPRRPLSTTFDHLKIDDIHIQKMISRFSGSIQFTPQRFSLLSPNLLLEDSIDRFLSADNNSTTRPFTRHFIKSIAKNQLLMTLKRRGGDRYLDLLKFDSPKISGAATEYTLALAIENGRPFLGGEVFSFAGADIKAQKKDVQSAAWAFKDIKGQHPDIILAALVVEGNKPSPYFNDAVTVLESSGASVVPNQDVPNWADDVVGKIFPQLLNTL